MAGSNQRRIVSFSAGLWAFALAMAVVAAYALRHPSETQSVHPLTGPAASDSYAGGTAPEVLTLPTITIRGGRSEGAESPP
jgi:hypothetical protein